MLEQIHLMISRKLRKNCPAAVMCVKRNTTSEIK